MRAASGPFRHVLRSVLQMSTRQELPRIPEDEKFESKAPRGDCRYDNDATGEACRMFYGVVPGNECERNISFE